MIEVPRATIYSLLSHLRIGVAQEVPLWDFRSPCQRTGQADITGAPAALGGPSASAEWGRLSDLFALSNNLNQEPFTTANATLTRRHTRASYWSCFQALLFPQLGKRSGGSWGIRCHQRLRRMAPSNGCGWKRAQRSPAVPADEPAVAAGAGSPSKSPSARPVTVARLSQYVKLSVGHRRHLPCNPSRRRLHQARSGPA